MAHYTSHGTGCLFQPTCSDGTLYKPLHTPPCGIRGAATHTPQCGIGGAATHTPVWDTGCCDTHTTVWDTGCCDTHTPPCGIRGAANRTEMLVSWHVTLGCYVALQLANSPPGPSHPHPHDHKPSHPHDHDHKPRPDCMCVWTQVQHPLTHRTVTWIARAVMHGPPNSHRTVTWIARAVALCPDQPGAYRHLCTLWHVPPDKGSGA